LEGTGFIWVNDDLRIADCLLDNFGNANDLNLCGSPPSAGGAGTQASSAFFIETLTG